eukprot:3057442-Amphidinium_carterae.1
MPPQTVRLLQACAAGKTKVWAWSRSIWNPHLQSAKQDNIEHVTLVTIGEYLVRLLDLCKPAADTQACELAASSKTRTAKEGWQEQLDMPPSTKVANTEKNVQKEHQALGETTRHDASQGKRKAAESTELRERRVEAAFGPKPPPLLNGL